MPRLADRIAPTDTRVVRITAKGQVTVPRQLRERFGITPDTDLEFRDEDGKLVLGRAATDDGVRAVRGSVKRLPFGADVDDYLATSRGRR